MGKTRLIEGLDGDTLEIVREAKDVVCLVDWSHYFDVCLSCEQIKTLIAELKAILDDEVDDAPSR